MNVDLASPFALAGAPCREHGETERYDVRSEDNICPKCEKAMLAILSVGRQV